MRGIMPKRHNDMPIPVPCLLSLPARTHMEGLGFACGKAGESKRPVLQFAFLPGCMRMTSEPTLCSCATKVETCGIEARKHSVLFGFTEEELDKGQIRLCSQGPRGKGRQLEIKKFPDSHSVDCDMPGNT